MARVLAIGRTESHLITQGSPVESRIHGQRGRNAPPPTAFTPNRMILHQRLPQACPGAPAEPLPDWISSHARGAGFSPPASCADQWAACIRPPPTLHHAAQLLRHRHPGFEQAHVHLRSALRVCACRAAGSSPRSCASPPGGPCPARAKTRNTRRGNATPSPWGLTYSDLRTKVRSMPRASG
jgi:hypothetical protein